MSATTERLQCCEEHDGDAPCPCEGCGRTITYDDNEVLTEDGQRYHRDCYEPADEDTPDAFPETRTCPTFQHECRFADGKPGCYQ